MHALNGSAVGDIVTTTLRKVALLYSAPYESEGVLEGCARRVLSVQTERSGRPAAHGARSRKLHAQRWISASDEFALDMALASASAEHFVCAAALVLLSVLRLPTPVGTKTT